MIDTWSDPLLRMKQSIKKKAQWSDPNFIWHSKEYKDSQAKKIESLWKDSDSGYQKLKGHYIITDPDGKVYNVCGLKEFCRKHNLENKYMARQANGRKPTPYKGWVCRHYQA